MNVFQDTPMFNTMDAEDHDQNTHTHVDRPPFRGLHGYENHTRINGREKFAVLDDSTQKIIRIPESVTRKPEKNYNEI